MANIGFVTLPDGRIDAFVATTAGHTVMVLTADAGHAQQAANEHMMYLSSKYPRLMNTGEISWSLSDEDNDILNAVNDLIKHDIFEIHTVN